MRELLTHSLVTAAAAVCIGLSSVSGASAQADQLGEGKTIHMARANWDTGWFVGEIYKQMLEELGYTVEGPTTLAAPAFYLAVSQGDVDFWVDGSFPLHNTYKDVFSSGAETVGYVAHAAPQGYLVDKASAEKYGITSLEDFKKQEVKKAFDRNGDGKADLVACPPGWGCEEVITHQLDAYELRGDINPIQAEYSASMAAAIAADKQDEPILFYTWTPNWTLHELKPGEDVVWIQVPEVSLPKDQMQFADAAIVEDVKGCVANPCVLGWPANDIRAVANSDFLNENPAVRTLLSEASVPLEDQFAQNAMMQAGADSPEDIKAQASAWIEKHRGQVDQWLQATRGSATE